MLKKKLNLPSNIQVKMFDAMILPISMYGYEFGV